MAEDGSGASYPDTMFENSRRELCTTGRSTFGIVEEKTRNFNNQFLITSDATNLSVVLIVRRKRFKRICETLLRQLL